MCQMIRIVFCICPALALSSGCATVNPRHDYERTADYIADATGHPDVYRPDDEEIASCSRGVRRRTSQTS